MKIDFANLTRAYKIQKLEIDKAIEGVVSTAAFIGGQEVRDLESELARYVGIKHAVSCASGTDALQIAMMALGIGVGDEVITTPFSFIATAESIALVGATPVFVDVDPYDFNIDVTKIEAAITSKTKAIMPVSLYGQMVDMDTLLSIAEHHNLHLIEDAAQSFGASYRGYKSCSVAGVSCTSFFPAKPLGCYGDGGAVFTGDTDLAMRLTSIREHGQTERYTHKYIGLTGRLDALQAAVLRVKLHRYDRDIEERQSLANYYDRHISSDSIRTPEVKKDYTSVWAQYTLLSESRDRFQKYMTTHCIPTSVHYPKPLHLQECFRYLDKEEGSYPVAEMLSGKVISIPMNPYFTEEEKAYIVKVINAYDDVSI